MISLREAKFMKQQCDFTWYFAVCECVNRLTGFWECEILLAVGKDANVIIKEVSPLVNSEFAIL